MLEATAPLLSVLLPAYGYAEGVARILTALTPWPADICELLVFDDSADDAVYKLVNSLRQCGCSHVQYVHHRPGLGPVANWNSLLDNARGRYVWLLHHDEFPIADQFLARLLAQLQSQPAPDVLMLDCLLVKPDSGRNRRHMPVKLRLAVAHHCPQYLYRRNVIGPVSSLVVRRTLYPRFEPELRWMVDVDAYVRLFSTVGSNVRLATDLQIGSLLTRGTSITASLRPNLGSIVRDERAWLRLRRAKNDIWLADARPFSIRVQLLLRTEGLAWACFRLGNRLAWWLGFSTIAPSMVRRALKTVGLP